MTSTLLAFLLFEMFGNPSENLGISYAFLSKKSLLKTEISRTPLCGRNLPLGPCFQYMYKETFIIIIIIRYLLSRSGEEWRNFYVRYMVTDRPEEDQQLLLRQFQIDNCMKFPRFNDRFWKMLKDENPSFDSCSNHSVHILKIMTGLEYIFLFTERKIVHQKN